jgi:hypothetical protein
MVRFRLLATDLVTHALHHLAMDLFQKGCEQAAQAANNACLSPQQFANAMNSMRSPRFLDSIGQLTPAGRQAAAAIGQAAAAKGQNLSRFLRAIGLAARRASAAMAPLAAALEQAQRGPTIGRKRRSRRARGRARER